MLGFAATLDPTTQAFSSKLSVLGASGPGSWLQDGPPVTASARLLAQKAADLTSAIRGMAADQRRATALTTFAQPILARTALLVADVCITVSLAVIFAYAVRYGLQQDRSERVASRLAMVEAEAQAEAASAALSRASRTKLVVRRKERHQVEASSRSANAE